ncbi:glycosyltransferase family 2 protein [Lunatibacter salilacus]|uniref:glycosyltransferase family 2 protein n=1 Tax=Lunatibacter salilacus TaxID=2483804 RepID=UPI00131E266B|nr:glycosyltransferase family 2 protein [Lunatibacter salilacus]
MELNEFKVSVIIPVYNAETYLEHAVKSAIGLPEVEEVILIEDNSPDNCLEICQKLEKIHGKVILLHHPNRENRGAGASRNLGIQHAKYEYIAFLDADDYFMPDRFEFTKKRFSEDPSIEALYEPVGTFFESEEAQLAFCKWRRLSIEASEKYITYPKIEYSGIPFFHAILEGKNGTPHINGITIKKEVLIGEYIFDKNLKLHQDSAFWIKIASRGRFYPGGHRNPVAIRRVHEENRIQNRNFHSVLLKDQYIYNWAKQADLDQKARNLIIRNYISSKTQKKLNSNSSIVKIIWRVIYYVNVTAKQIFQK